MFTFFNLKYLYSGKLRAETVKAYLQMNFPNAVIEYKNNKLCIKKKESICIFIRIRQERIELYSSVSEDCLRRCKRYLYIPYTYFRISGRSTREEFLKEVTNYLQLRFGE